MAIRVVAGATAAACWAGLAIQFAIIVQSAAALAAAGMLDFPLPAAVTVFLLFLTVHINLLAAVIMTAAAFGLGFGRNGRLRGALAAYMAAASLVFVLALQPVWNHHGSQHVADVLLHNVTPVLYLAYWMMGAPKAALRWRDPLVWLIYPLLYLGAMLAVAHAVGFYPYPVIDVRLLPAGALAANVAAVAAVFLASGFAVVALARAVAPPDA